MVKIITKQKLNSRSQSLQLTQAVLFKFQNYIFNCIICMQFEREQLKLPRWNWWPHWSLDQDLSPLSATTSRQMEHDTEPKDFPPPASPSSTTLSLLFLLLLLLLLLSSSSSLPRPIRKTLKSEQERERERRRLNEMELGQGWENKGKRIVIWDLKSWGWTRLNFYFVGFFLWLPITLVQSTLPTVAIHCRCLHLPVDFKYFF